MRAEITDLPDGVRSTGIHRVVFKEIEYPLGGEPVARFRYLGPEDEQVRYAWPDQRGVHLSHCYQGENPGWCKYGDDDCPAKPADGQPQLDIARLSALLARLIELDRISPQVLGIPDGPEILAIRVGHWLRGAGAGTRARAASKLPRRARMLPCGCGVRALPHQVC